MFRAATISSNWLTNSLADDLEIMIKTLQTALTPLLIIGSFCNLGLFEYPVGHPRPYLSYLYILGIWSLFTYSVYYPTYIHRWHRVYIWINIIILISTIIMILVSLFRSKVRVLKCTPLIPKTT